MTYLCAAIFVTDPAQARRDIAMAAEAGADMVELRIDRFHNEAELATLVDNARLPTIVTCRPTWEGGQCDLPEPRRLKLLSGSAASRASYVDLELEAYEAAPEDAKAAFSQPRILSAHD